MTKRRHTVTDIVGAVYCEQKVVLDRRHGKATTRDVQRKAAQGTFEHLRFEVEGYTRNPMRLLAKLAQDKPRPRHKPKADSRCFIATQLYGAEANETNVLRAWRDTVLMPSRSGRLLVTLYYRTSPALVETLKHSAWLTRLAKRCLDAIVARIGGAA